MNKENKRLYVDISQWGAPTRYFYENSDLKPMIWKKFKNMPAIEERVFTYICNQYSNVSESNTQPLELSYSNIAEIINASELAVRKAIKRLITNKLIVAIGERKGRLKTRYLPNIQQIHKWLKEYVESKYNVSHVQ